jgi:GNAT superfamily N-acetyltransferase
MGVEFVLVDGRAFAAEAAAILQAAWPPGALRYTPAYVKWQLSFPSAGAMPAAAAFVSGQPVGFVGATSRHARCDSGNLEIAVVSFVAVRPDWRRQGIAAGLYRTLLRSLAASNVPVLTFGISSSNGERAILRAYPEAGFRLKPAGTYDVYGFAGGGDEPADGWTANVRTEFESVLPITEEGPGEEDSVLWASPSRHQIKHYAADPRPRKLIVAEHASTGARGAAFAVRAELQAAGSIAAVTIVDSIWLPRPAAAGLRSLLKAAADVWPEAGRRISCPNLSGFDDSDLRPIGVRRTGSQFRGYFCTSDARAWPEFQRTNLEIV